MPKVSDQHRADRRRQILDGARAAFARHGYEGATVSRLEAEIGLSRGAIFSYFPSKWAIFYALAQDDQERVFQLILDQGFGAVIRLMAEESPDWLGVYFELIRKLRTDLDLRDEWSNRTPELNQRVTERFRQLQERGEFRRDLPVDAIGEFLGLIIDGVAVHVTAGYPVDTDSLLKLVSAAIAPQ
ncbi:MAG TPA: TetR/AcrR family transcriptional regulator [Gaiellaceae bacterium]|nr:TetR/AcrR family transcriptional regulator [Gaiellaceae bacterium]